MGVFMWKTSFPISAKEKAYLFESELCKSKMVTVSVEFRTQKFLGTVLGTKSRFRDKKTPTRVSFYMASGLEQFF